MKTYPIAQIAIIAIAQLACASTAFAGPHTDTIEETAYKAAQSACEQAYKAKILSNYQVSCGLGAAQAYYLASVNQDDAEAIQKNSDDYCDTNSDEEESSACHAGVRHYMNHFSSTSALKGKR